MTDPGHPEAKAFVKNVFIGQERRSGERKRLDTVVVLTVNDSSCGERCLVLLESWRACAAFLVVCVRRVHSKVLRSLRGETFKQKLPGEV